MDQRDYVVVTLAISLIFILLSIFSILNFQENKNKSDFEVCMNYCLKLVEHDERPCMEKCIENIGINETFETVVYLEE